MDPDISNAPQPIIGEKTRISKRVRLTQQTRVQFSIKGTAEEKIELTFPSPNRFLIRAGLVCRPLLGEPAVPSAARNQNTIVSMTVVFASIRTLILEHSWHRLHSHPRRKCSTGSAPMTNGKKLIEIRLPASTGRVHRVPLHPFLPGGVGNKCRLMALQGRNRWNELELPPVI